MTQNEQYPVLKEYYFKLKKRDTEYRKVNLKVIFYSYLLLAVALFIIYFTTILNFIFEFSFSLADFISITIFIYAFIASGAWTALATLIIIETMGKKGIWFKKHVEKNLSGDEELYFRIFNVLSHLKKWEDTNNPEHIKLAKKWLK
ncbi:MAG: hypothetical protein JW703_03265, partial [Candidatus Diapherotrites archaeon]|nr:hypothetical protein [Candidatus Diapherotrites archaeon]